MKCKPCKRILILFILRVLSSAEYYNIEISHLLQSTDHLRKVYENVRCVDSLPLTKGLASNVGLDECRQNCIGSDLCEYFAFWPLQNWCETYESCFYQESDGENTINVFKRMSHCDVANQIYMKLIPRQFPTAMVKADVPNPNFHCQCISKAWMFCVIFAAPGTAEHAAVQKKFDRYDAEKMKPFVLWPSRTRTVEQQPIIFRQGPKSVNAEIEVWPPGKCFHVSKCVRGTPGRHCPFSGRPFKSGDPVYVLKSAMTDIEKGTPVSCYSMAGFRDGMRGRPIYGLNHAIYLVFDDADMATGICAEGISKFKNIRQDLDLGVPDDLDFSQPEETQQVPRRGGRRKPALKGKGSMSIKLQKPAAAAVTSSGSPGSSSSATAALDSTIASIQGILEADTSRAGSSPKSSVGNPPLKSQLSEFRFSADKPSAGSPGSKSPMPPVQGGSKPNLKAPLKAGTILGKSFLPHAKVVPPPPPDQGSPRPKSLSPKPPATPDRASLRPKDPMSPERHLSSIFSRGNPSPRWILATFASLLLILLTFSKIKQTHLPTYHGNQEVYLEFREDNIAFE